MLSIIICSRSPEAVAAISENVAATIGAPYELIAIDNSQNRYGICEAYNVGARQAQYELLCFMHEDIKFHTPDWGRVVAAILADPTVGVLGVAGSQYQLHAPSSWWFAGEEYQRMQVLHTVANKEPVLDLVNPANESLVDVAVLDGIWLCSRKEVWAAHPFDAQTFPEFHFYDIDYCTALFPNYRVCVTFDILIEHFSLGSINKMWVTNSLKYYDKWRASLPFGTVRIAPAKEQKLEADAIYHLIDLLLWHKLPLKTILHWLSEAARLNKLDRRLLGVAKQVVRHRLLK